MEIPIVVNPNAPKPDKLKKPVPENSQAGWWSLRDIAGSLRGVTEAVNDALDIPAYWKEAIVKDLTARCGTEFNFVYLDVHCMVEKGNTVIHYHATPDKKLL